MPTVKTVIASRLLVLVAVMATAVCGLAAAAGEPGPAVQVSVNAHGGRGFVPKHVATAVAASGRQLVAWRQDGEEHGVWARILDGSGAVVGDPFRVSADATDPAVAARGRRDEFLVVWTELGGPEYRVVARRFDGDGKSIGQEFVITDAGQEPDLAYGGKRKEFTIVWREYPFDGSRIYGARLAAGSSVPSPPFRISRNASADGSYDSPQIAYASRADGYLVVWHRISAETLESRALMRTLPGEPDGRFGRQRTIDKSGVSPRVTYNRHTGEYLVLWGAPGSPVRRVRSNGRPYGDQVSTIRGTDFESAGSSDIAAAADGHYDILFWGDQLEDSIGYSAVYRRRLGAELKLGRGLRQISSVDPRVDALLGGQIAYSRVGDRFRAVWVEGRQRRDPNQFPGDPPSNWEVWTRGL